jgi:hypothetical protein
MIVTGIARPTPPRYRRSIHPGCGGAAFNAASGRAPAASRRPDRSA